MRPRAIPWTSGSCASLPGGVRERRWEIGGVREGVGERGLEREGVGERGRERESKREGVRERGGETRQLHSAVSLSHQKPEVNYLPRFGPQLICLERSPLRGDHSREIDLLDNLDIVHITLLVVA